MKMKDNDEIVDMMADILRCLARCREEIDEVFLTHGYDSAYFDVDINMRVSIDDITVDVSESWEKMEI